MLKCFKMYWLAGFILISSIFNIYDCSFSDRVEIRNGKINIRYEFQVMEQDQVSFWQAVDLELFGELQPSNCSTDDLTSYCQQWGSLGQFIINKTDDECDEYHFRTKTTAPLLVTFDRKNIYLSGGSEIDNQTYPIKVVNGQVDSFVSKQYNSEAILEPIWYTNDGFYLKVNQSTPLFVNYTQDFLSLNASRAAPYIRGDTTYLDYRVCKYDDMKIAYQRAIDDSVGKPLAAPDYRMVELPIWSTWAKYKRAINESAVLEFANLINSHGLPNSQLEIDDMWETCYGSLLVDKNRFPDMKKLVDKLHSMGFRVTMWVHPFVNVGCDPFYSLAAESGFFVKNGTGYMVTQWWNGNGSYIDFTNPQAVEWYRSRLQTLLHETGIDSFKFDAGESGWSPQVPVFHHMTDDHPETILKAYIPVAASFGKMVEVRSARQTQKYPIFVRMMDRNTEWKGVLGMNTLIPELLHMNIIGYPFVLPDMIGGDEYGNDTLTKEMFVRWLQITIFMPSIQFSFPPWDFGDEVVNITRKYIEIHKQYAPLIYQLMQKATVEPTMVNPPIWWIDPQDPVAQRIDSEFLLGGIVLVAPVLEKGATSRDIYFPKGIWQDETIKDAAPIIGPTWVKNYPASLEVLPYFTLKIPTSSSSTLSPSLFVILVVSLVFFYKY